MLKKGLRWLRKHYKLATSLFLLLLFLVWNVIAYRHAFAMTHFLQGGSRTEKPETLSLIQKATVLITGVRLLRPENRATPTSLGLSFESHRFNSTGGHQLEAWYLPHSNAKRLVLLFHGYAASKASLLAEASAFREMDCATLLVDFRGSGGSTGDHTTIGVEEADDVTAAFEYARRNWPEQPVVLYGHSMGSAAILRALAQVKVEPQAVVLECPFDRLLSTVTNRFAIMGLPAFPSDRLLVFWGGEQHGFNGFQHNPVDYAKAVECPVLLLHGERDSRVSMEQLDSIYQNLRGVKKLEVFAGVGHESYVRACPKQWKDAVAGFLGRCP
jgi:alpha-beta hydrolase superfamily lysophospholipase